uniref:Uncharacterized protein n=1 Tax=Parascaris equorum TaxID=6256 RepID=A0A914SET8_PAREQ
MSICDQNAIRSSPLFFPNEDDIVCNLFSDDCLYTASSDTQT